MKRHFDVELKELKKKILEMDGMVEAAIDYSIKALVDRDEKLILEVTKKEEGINKIHLDIDDICLKLLALHQPMAADLRFIAAALRINSELERIGDMAVNITDATRELLNEPPLKPLIDIPKMSNLSRQMTKDALDAFINRDIELAKNVILRDDEVDDLKDQLFRELLTYMMSDPKAIKRALELILVSRHLERIGDHATNIAEDVVFMVLGEDIRHPN